MLPIEENDPHQPDHHEPDTDSGPRLGEAAEAQLVVGRGTMGPMKMRARRSTLPGLDPPDSHIYRFQQRLVGGHLRPQAVQFLRERGYTLLMRCTHLLEMRESLHSPGFDPQPHDLVTLLGDLLRKAGQPKVHLSSTLQQLFWDLLGRWHLVEAGPAQGIVPGTTHCPVPVVERPSGRVFAGDGIASVEPPQATVARGPPRCGV